MNSESMLISFVLKAAATQELSFTEDDIIPIEFCAMTDMATGEYYNIQYVIFERPSKRSVWKCSSIGNDKCVFAILTTNENDNLHGALTIQ